MRVPLLDLVSEYHGIKAEIDQAIQSVLEGAQFILGPNVTALEKEIADYLGVTHAVGVASGTDALILGLRAAGIGPGDEVIVPTYTFFATAEAVLQVGAKPVFVDCLADTYSLDASQLRARLTSRTRAILPVHLYGHPADMTPVLAFAQEHGLKVVEDAAQAFGAMCNGQRVGAMGDVGCLSFFPSKNLGGYGDGGMVVTNDGEVAERVRMLRTHGWRRKYEPEMVGYNSRLDELQAAILRVKLRHVEEWNELRRGVARAYGECLRGMDLVLPVETAGARHVYHLYVVRARDRAQVQAALKEAQVGSAVYYPIPVHLTQPCLEMGYKKGDFPVAEAASGTALAIPIYPGMGSAEMDHVVSALKAGLQ
ncbi:MAG: DegT/DnrJ/EryC1/StrS family aminotransferase [Candidatus Latescibacterota bacterium]